MEQRVKGSRSWTEAGQKLYELDVLGGMFAALSGAGGNTPFALVYNVIDHEFTQQVDLNF